MHSCVSRVAIIWTWCYWWIEKKGKDEKRNTKENEEIENVNICFNIRTAGVGIFSTVSMKSHSVKENKTRAYYKLIHSDYLWLESYLIDTQYKRALIVYPE